MKSWGQKLGEGLLEILKPISDAVRRQERRQDSTDALLVDLVTRVEALEQQREVAAPKLRQVS
jgi:hypothetical protein